METDARGQLGGLDCSKAERERIAEGSGNWKCGVCAKNNREILAECEEAVKEKENEGEAAAEDVVIPQELKMGYKDEMGKEKTIPAETAGTSQESVEAEPIVHKTDAARHIASTQPYPPARPGQTVAQPTGHAQPRIQPLPTQTQHVQQREIVYDRSSDGVPMWIDRAIAGVVVLLVAMVLKILLGY
jgi:ubiquitin-conjugating enzyme E2 J1